METAPTRPSWTSFVNAVDRYLRFHEHEPNRLTVRADAGSNIAAARDMAIAPGASNDVAFSLILLALQTLDGATQHLRAVRILVEAHGPTTKLARPIESAARNCCEAAARVAWLLDPSVDSTTRVGRGFTASLATLPLNDPRQDQARGAVAQTARNLGLTVKDNKHGKPIRVGTDDLPKSGVLFGGYLSTILNSDSDAALIWKHWSGSTHLDPFAAMAGSMLDTQPGLLAGAASAAIGAHVMVSHTAWEYLGRFEDGRFKRRALSASAGAMLGMMSIPGSGLERFVETPPTTNDAAAESNP